MAVVVRVSLEVVWKSISEETALQSVTALTSLLANRGLITRVQTVHLSNEDDWRDVIKEVEINPRG